MSAIADTFARLRESDQAAFMPFIAAGDPDVETSINLVLAAAAGGADLIELGIPFSDPIADGPTIQSAFTRALSGGATVDSIFDAFAAVQDKITVPVLAMLSYSIVARLGEGDFFTRLKETGFSGAIIPDLPPEEGAACYAAAEAAGVDTVLLAAPTTTPERRDLIIKQTRGFLYYVSVAGITGARSSLPEDMAERLAELKARADVPVCLGFGVGSPEQAAQVAVHADGVIVGSAIVKRVEASAAGGKNVVAEVSAFIKELADAVHGART